MAYIAVEKTTGLLSIEEEIGAQEAAKLSGDANGQSIDAAFWNQKIARAQSVVDAKFAVHHDVPFTDGSVPALAQQAALVLAIYYAYESRKGNGPEWIRVRFEDTMKMLDDVASGKAKVYVSDTDAPIVQPSSSFIGSTRLFGRSI